MSAALLDWEDEGNGERMIDEGSPVQDNVNNPSHYNQFGIEVVDILEMYFPHNPHLWNAGKYLLRSGYKGHEVEDLKKLVWYVERYIKFKESNDDNDAVPEVSKREGNQR